MARNLVTRLRCRVRPGCPMATYDALPPELRRWLAGAALPWSAASVLRIWRAAGRDGGRALARLGAAERRRLASDTARVWGRGHPQATRISDLP